MRMSFNAFYVAAHLLVAALYLLLSWRTWRALTVETAARPAAFAFPTRAALPFLALLHGGLVAADMFGGFGGPGESGDHAFRFGFAHALSATLWLTVLIVWVEGFFVPTLGLQPLVLPVAAVCAVLPAFFRGGAVALGNGSAALKLHLLVAIAAYSLLTIAALHALLMASLDRQLHAAGAEQQGFASRMFRHAPPLLALERLLFHLIGAGFVLLTLTLVSGVLFSEYLFGRPLRFDHKTVFAIASWLVFGGLLAGRWTFGWRGRVALRWTLAGFVMLLLAYVGTRFVLEVILHRI